MISLRVAVGAKGSMREDTNTFASLRAGMNQFFL
jgi:hypothetical protein